MVNQKTSDWLSKSENIMKNLEKMEKFRVKYQMIPSQEASRIAVQMHELASSIPAIANPSNEDELILQELKRRFGGEAGYLEQTLRGDKYDFNSVINVLGIPREDIDSLRPWLQANKSATQSSLERLFHSRNIEDYELPLKMDVPGVKSQAEHFSGVHVNKYHKVIGNLIQKLTEVGTFLREIDAVVTHEHRSYFNPLTKDFAISIPAICSSGSDKILRIKDGELIRLYGHEGMGHALNRLLTDIDPRLPYFLKQDSHLTVASEESVAQFYEERIFEDLNRSPETQKALGIAHIFPAIYQEFKDTEQIAKWKKKMMYYGISVLADKSLGDPKDPAVVKRKIAILEDVEIDRSIVGNWVEGHRNEYDSEGNLKSGIVAELRYCADPVGRALAEFKKAGIDYAGQGRSLIDRTLLTGLWTPQGFVDNARYRAQAK